MEPTNTSTQIANEPSPKTEEVSVLEEAERDIIALLGEIVRASPESQMRAHAFRREVSAIGRDIQRWKQKENPRTKLTGEDKKRWDNLELEAWDIRKKIESPDCDCGDSAAQRRIVRDMHELLDKLQSLMEGVE